MKDKESPENEKQLKIINGEQEKYLKKQMQKQCNCHDER